MSQQDFTNYINSWIGKRYDGDNYPPEAPFQCTDWPAKFVQDWMGQLPLGMRISGGAKDWFEDFGNSGARPEWGAERIFNSLTNFPMAGDIVIWGSNLGRGFGHVAVSDFNDNSDILNVIEQNGIGNGQGTGGDAIRRFNRPQAPLGWIRIPGIYDNIFASTTNNTTNNDDMALAQNLLNQLQNKGFKLDNNGTNWYSRLQGLINEKNLDVFLQELTDVAIMDQNAFANTVNSLKTDLANRQKLGTTEIPADIQTALDNQKADFEIEKASLVQQIMNLQNQIRQYQIQKQASQQVVNNPPTLVQPSTTVSAPQFWQQLSTNPTTIVPVQLNPADIKNSSTKNFFQSKKAWAYILGLAGPVLTNLIPNLSNQTQVTVVAASTILTAVYMYVQGKVDEKSLQNQILTQVSNVEQAFSK